MAEIVGPDRTGVRLSPNEERQGVNDSNPEPLFEAASAALSEIGIAFLEVREPGYDGTNGKAERPPVAPRMRAAFPAPSCSIPITTGRAARPPSMPARPMRSRSGVPSFANPDLPRRIAEGLPLSADDSETWYTGGAKGYVDIRRRGEGLAFARP